MAEITAALVKALREKTGAGMMDCKKALIETGGDLDQAVDWLRKKGLSAAAKKSGRLAAEGLVGVAIGAAAGALVEVNAETDFVARNETFQDFVRKVAAIALEQGGDLEAVKAAPYPGTDRTVAEELTHLIARVGENMTLRRTRFLSADRGVLASYVHNAVAPGLGRIGVLVAVEGDGKGLEDLAKKLAMHVAASEPVCVSREDLDPALVEKEREILAEQARASGKPENIIEKMVEGRLRKFYEEVCLLDQIYAIDGESKVSGVLEEAGKAAGGPVTVRGFVRFKLGEGLARKEGDFAAEVAAAAAGG